MSFMLSVANKPIMLTVVMVNVVAPNNAPSPPSTKELHGPPPIQYFTYLTSILHLGVSLYEPLGYL
jgi:hypothetical protein